MFKKTKLQARKKHNSKFISSIGFFAVSGIFILALVAVNRVGQANLDVYKTFIGSDDSVEDIITLSAEEQADAILQEKIIQIKQQEDAKILDDSQKTNILILGRGGYGHDAPELTDSIILASIHKEKNHITLMSIPRDLYVKYGDYNKAGTAYKGKINGLYIHYLNQFQDEEKAVEKLQEKITEITNEKIDYYVNIDFNGFIKLVDAIGGVQIDVPETLVDNSYPDNNLGYQTFILRKGSWLIDGNVALKYVRSRKNTGGDFGRSERQQQVISALKDNILSGDTLSSPTKIRNFYNIYNQYLTTNIGITQAVKLFSQIKLQKDTKVYSSGLNTSCTYEEKCEKGGYLYYPQRVYFGGISVLLSESTDYLNLDVYTKIREYSDIVFNSPKLFDEKYKISIFSKLEDKLEAQQLREEFKKIGLEINEEEIIGTIPEPSLIEATGEDVEEEITSTRINLEEYNSEGFVNNNNTTLTTANNIGIAQESNNTVTKIIINGVDRESESLKYLQKFLQIDDEDIVENIDGPLYARDPNTQIEIIYTQ